MMTSVTVLHIYTRFSIRPAVMWGGVRCYVKLSDIFLDQTRCLLGQTHSNMVLGQMQCWIRCGVRERLDQINILIIKNGVESMWCWARLSGQGQPWCKIRYC